VHWPLSSPLLFKFLDVYFSIIVRIGDGERESESETDEKICAFYEIAIKFIAAERESILYRSMRD